MFEEHVQHVHTILKKPIENKLVTKQSKCELYKLKISFLGHVVKIVLKLTQKELKLES